MSHKNFILEPTVTTGIIAVILASSSLHCGASRRVSEDGREAVDLTVNVTVGQPAYLTCALSGSDRITWEFERQDGFSLVKLVDRDVLKTQDPNEPIRYSLDRHHRLAISSVTRDDTGKYSCYKGDSSERYSIYLYARMRPLKTTPQNMYVISGEEARFQCSTYYSHGQVWWTFISIGRTENYVYLNGGLVIEYTKDGRHEVDRSQPSDLIISKVQPDDAGKYTCWDDDGLGTKGFAELTVIDPQISCNSNVSTEGAIVESDLDIEPDRVDLSCRVRYRGNIPPKLQWSYNSIDFESNVTSDSGGVIVYTASVGTLSMTSNSTPYVCRIEGINKTRTCSIESIPLLYAFNPDYEVIDDGYGLECRVNTSVPNVILKWVDSETDAILSNTSILHSLSDPTTAHCEAEIQIRNESHKLKGPDRILPNARAKDGHNKIVTTIAVIVVVASIIIVPVCVGFCWKFKKQELLIRKYKRSGTEQMRMTSTTEDTNNTRPVEETSLV